MNLILIRDEPMKHRITHGESCMKNLLEKVIRARVCIENGLLVDVSITGDFFVYPESGLEAIEKSIRGVSITSNDLASRIATTIADEQIELVGISSSSMANAVSEAIVKSR